MSCFYRLFGGRLEFKANQKSLLALLRATKSGLKPATLPNSRTWEVAMPDEAVVRTAIADISHAYTLCDDFALVVAAENWKWSDPEDILKKKNTV